MTYIVSHEAQSVEFPKYVKTKAGVSANSSVLIKGGADVINKKTMHTPAGVITEVSKEDLAFLKTQYLFNYKVENGSYEIVENEKKAKEQAKKRSPIKDQGAQLTAKDFEDAGQTPPKVGASEKADDGSELAKSQSEED